MNTTNRLPGSLIYSGDYKTEPLVIDVYEYDDKAWLHKVYTHVETITLSKKNTWINITGLHNINLLKTIESRFKISRFSLEDIVQVSTNSKIDTFEHYTFSIFKMLYLKSDKIKHEHVSIIKLDNVLITFQETAGDVFDGVRHTIEEKIGDIRTENVDFLYYRLIDALIDQYFEILPRINQKLEKLEYAILEDQNATLENIYLIRKELLLIRNSVMPLKLLLQNYLNKNITHYKLHYSDLFDHLDQITEQVTLYRDIITNLYDTHMSNLSHKMNKVMTTLAIFSAIFIPLSFLAGFFGMNFRYFPGLDSVYSIYLFMAACVAIGGGMYAFFKHKNLF